MACMVTLIYAIIFWKHCHVTQVAKTFNSTVALQEGFLKHLGDVATVLLDLVCVCVCVCVCVYDSLTQFLYTFKLDGM